MLLAQCMPNLNIHNSIKLSVNLLEDQSIFLCAFSSIFAGRRDYSENLIISYAKNSIVEVFIVTTHHIENDARDILFIYIDTSLDYL